MTSLVGGLADKASSLLGGGPAAPPAPKVAAATATWDNKGALEDQSANAPGATALEHPNIFDPKLPIEFIHFGHCYQDVNDRFLHESLDDTKPDALKDKFGSHASMFRAAMEREAILVDGFIAAAQGLVKEMAASQTPLDSVVGAVGSLLGGSTAKPGPDPSQLDPYKTAIDTAGGSVNVEAIQYADIHAAGISLHQGWCDFDAFAPKMSKPADAKDGAGGGLLGNLPSVGNLGAGADAFGGAVSAVTGILFKMFDIYEAIYQSVRKKYEPPIRENCHLRTIAAIRTRQQPLFDIWTAPPAAVAPLPDAPQNIVATDPSGVKPIDKIWDSAADPVNSGYKDAQKEKRKLIDDWKKFWDTDPPDTPGTAELKAILSAISKAGNEVWSGFTSVITHPLPDIVQTLVQDIVDATCAMLGAVYLQLQDPAVADQLNDKAYFAAGQKFYEDLLSGYLIKLITGVLPLNSIGMGSASVSSAMIVKKLAKVADDDVGKDIDPILALAMCGLSDILQKTMKEAKANQSLTMEIYLAQLPLLIALTTRNTFFPLWQLVVDKVFGTAGGVASAIASPVAALMKKGRDLAAGIKAQGEDLDSSIRDKSDKADRDFDRADQGIHRDLDAAHIHMATPEQAGADRINQLVDKTADDILGRGSPTGANTPPPSFPGSSRKTMGSGVEITKSVWMAVNAKDKYPFPNQPY